METSADLNALRSARERLGLLPQQIADAVGISAAHAWDLENHESEIAMALSLAQVARLCTLLNLRLQDLFPKADFAVAKSLSLAELRDRVEAFCRSAGLSIEQFGNKAGWEISSFMTNAHAAIKDWNLDCMRDVCRTLSVATEPYLTGMIEAEQPPP